MSLKTEIDRTETEKNKTKQVAINIDNKLVELGGQRATNLADVPNKIELMVRQHYKRVAIADVFIRKYLQNGEINIPLNLQFVPSRIILKVDVNTGFGDLFDINSRSGNQKIKIEGSYFEFNTVINGNKSATLKISSRGYSAFDFTIMNWIAIG